MVEAVEPWLNSNVGIGRLVGNPLVGFENFRRILREKSNPPQVLQNRLVRIIRRLRKSDHIANNSLYHKLNT